jgi:hypothetical protein
MNLGTQVVKPLQQFLGAGGMELIGKPQVEHQERHGNAEYGIAQRIKPRTWVH